MKPTPQIRQHHGFPLTDYNYQSTLNASCAGAKETRGVHRLRGFWRLGTEFHGAEAVYGDAADFLVFTLIALLCTWPIVSVVIAIARVIG
jgi:hypothetical protein